jgi:hypothetical protein
MQDEELIAALNIPVDLDFDLPDPEDESLPEFDFQKQIDDFWKICDKFDLQTEIWRGRILKTVRDREKNNGEGRGIGFLNWLKEREITKSQAYNLIQLANSADTLLSEGMLEAEAINRFSKRAFIETAKADPEIQRLVGEAAQNGEHITRREVKQLSEQLTALSSDLLPYELKVKAEDGSLSPRYLAPLIKELEKLPIEHIASIQQEVAQSPDVDTVKNMTTEARSLGKYLDAAAQVQTLRKSSVEIGLALEEALRLDCLSTAADLVKQAIQLEQTVAKLYTNWKRLAYLADRLYIDTGASNPHLRSMITALEILTGEVIEVDLDDAGQNTVKLKIFPLESSTEAPF